MKKWFWLLLLSTVTLWILWVDAGKVKDRHETKAMTAKNDVLSSDRVAGLTETKKNDLPEKKNKVTADSNEKGFYTLRKYDHVREFFSRISGPATLLCVKNNVPPAAVLGMAALESGWNRGYVGRITGNIMSLGARHNDPALPALRLPRLKSTGEILFDSLEIIKYSPGELVWEDRPPSLKKDYRPKPIAGTPYQLAYFKYHQPEKANAEVMNINDFLTVFISHNSRIAAYRQARHLMDSLVGVHGKQVLFEQHTVELFIFSIGGKPNSFNYRITWPGKVLSIVKGAGLTELTKKLYTDNKQFNEVW